PDRRGVQRPPVAQAEHAGTGRRGTLDGVSALPDRLPASGGRAARHARALGALPRLRNRIRYRRASARSRASPDAPGDARPELDLLDQRKRQPWLGSERSRYREARRRLRLGAHTARRVLVLIELQLQLELRFRRKLLRRRWRWRRGRWRWCLVRKRC